MIPTLGLAVSVRRKPGTKPHTYDCGRYGPMTLDQIAAAAGITRNAARYRVDKLGLRGEEVIQHTRQLREPSKLKPRMNRPALRVAMKLARAFPDRVPSADEIIATHPMCRSAANNYRAEIAYALRELAA